jgi:hypothetical protein
VGLTANCLYGHIFGVHNRVMGSLQDIKNQLLEMQKDPRVDLIQVFAVMIHQEQQKYANALVTIEQGNAAIQAQNATLLKQSTTILELRAEIARLRAENPAK